MIGQFKPNHKVIINHILSDLSDSQFLYFVLNFAEKHVHIPIKIEQDSTTLINQTRNSNQKPIHWPTIIICIIFVITGKSIVKLLENFYYNQIQRRDYNNAKRQNVGVWTQSLLQTVGFPLLLFPFIIFTAKTTHNHRQQPPITSQSHPSSTILILSFSGCIGVLLTNHGRLAAMGKLEIPFGIFTLIYTTQLFFTPIFAAFINKIKFNRWIVISLILAIITGALTSSSSFAEVNYSKVLIPAICFSLLLCSIEYVFKIVESTTGKTSFASVFQVIILSSIFATFISVVSLLIYGEQEDLKREMNGFSKGKVVYVMVMVGQAVSWQVYWVGIVGLVFSVSSVFSNVISVITWPIVSVLVVMFFSDMDDDEFDVFKGVALITAALSAAVYFYKLHKENRKS